MAMAWVPKATVQAALCSVILTDAKDAKNDVMIGYGQTINTLAIFAILITAPFGATFISTFGPKFLEKAESKVGPEAPQKLMTEEEPLEDGGLPSPTKKNEEI